jgi:hypothetical protein
LATISSSEEAAFFMFRVQVRRCSGRIACDTRQNMRRHNAIDCNLRSDSFVIFCSNGHLLRDLYHCTLPPPLDYRPDLFVHRLIACHRCCWASNLNRIKNLTDWAAVIKYNLASTLNLLLLLVYTFHLFLREDGVEVVKASKSRATKISSLVTKRFQ